jgi:hypothetical protein
MVNWAVSSQAVTGEMSCGQRRQELTGWPPAGRSTTRCNPLSWPASPGATGFRERGSRLAAGGRGRVDLAVVTDDTEKMLIIIEIKGTDWDKIRAGRVKRNVQRHIRQLLAYLDTAIGELEAGQWEGVAGALLYPSRPASTEALACVQAAADEQAIMSTWYDETDWRR